MLTSLAIIATSGLMILELLKKPKGDVKVFWPLVYVFTGINVVVWTLVGC